MAWFNQFQHLWNQQAPSAPADPSVPLSNPMDTGIARRATPAEIAAGGYVPPPQPQTPFDVSGGTTRGFEGPLPQSVDNLPSGPYQDVLNRQPMPQFDPGYGLHGSAGGWGPQAPIPPEVAARRPLPTGAPPTTFSESMALKPSWLTGGGPPGNTSVPQGQQGGTLSSLWKASPQGMTVPNQPYRPFTGQPQQPQQTSRFGMPQQSNAGSGSGYRRMRAPTGEERDIHESQAQHFLSRGGKWA